MESGRLLYLLNKYKDNALNEKEDEELEHWYDLLNTGTTSSTEHTEVNLELADEMLTEFRQSRLRPTTPVRKVGFSKMFTRVAAIVTGIGFIGAAYFLVFNKSQKEIASTEKQAQPNKNDVAPGGNKAILTLANGEQIILDSAANGILAQQGNAKVVKLANGELAYNITDDHANDVLFNTMSTPRGGQYRLTLPDGSEVWLNAASSIRYPTNFVGKERRVEITGEAYFEVTKNELMPFKVVMNNQEEVEVLGTHFNVNAYTGEEPVKTTLLEGSIKLTHRDETILLKPGQQSAFTEKGFSITEPDIGKVIAWKTGFFDFDNTSLAAIMRQISRWYNVDIVYEGQLTTAAFGGRISRNLTLSNLLKMFEENGVVFRLEGKTLFVRP